MPNLRKMNAGEFARRLRDDSEIPDKRFAFFLGAGCSISSGIPGAGALVKDYWLPKLQEVCAPDPNDFNIWLKKELPDYDPNNPAASYGKAIELLFLNPEDRQREIERLCERKFPGFGYAVLATLIAKDAGSFNVVITTNFDDLISDALFLFTRARPLVIGHESLAGFIRPTRTRPLVVKIHGDARLSPQNTLAETSKIRKEVENQVKSLLHDRALIFIGYGGNDKGIKKMLSGLPKEALPFGVYWISGSEPTGVLRPWLEERNAIWVEKFDFDEMMLLIRDAFELPHPDQKPFEKVFQDYLEKYKTLSSRIRSAPVKAEDETLKNALERADKDFIGWLSVVIAAEKFEKDNPDMANEIYANGIKRFSSSAPLIGAYALFLVNIRKDNDKAEQFYLRAIDIDPKDADTLGNYALFLVNIRKDNDKAERFYLRAVDADPNHANNLLNYALFLHQIRKDNDKAEQFYLRAIEANPNEVKVLSAYALFLHQIRKDNDKAEQFYLRAIEADPNHENTLGAYALFLHQIRKDNDKAEQFYLRAIGADPNRANTLGNYALFLENIRKDNDKAEQFYQRAIEADPNEANPLSNYALFLKDIRKDNDKAEQFYLRAINADPNEANYLSNYALFLKNIRKDNDKAEQFYQRAIEADPNEANTLGNYAGFVLARGNTEKGYHLLDKAISLLPASQLPGLAAELWFYAFCHWPEHKRNEAQKNLKAVLLSGERSPDWDLSPNIQRARQDGHPEIKWIEILADVITKGEDIKKLDDWQKWKEA